MHGGGCVKSTGFLLQKRGGAGCCKVCMGVGSNGGGAGRVQHFAPSPRNAASVRTCEPVASAWKCAFMCACASGMR